VTILDFVIRKKYVIFITGLLNVQSYQIRGEGGGDYRSVKAGEARPIKKDIEQRVVVPCLLEESIKTFF
jgi:hypothetical protein